MRRPGRRTVILLDTCALIYDALQPSRLSKRARAAIESAARTGDITISDITLWEIVMLVEKGRLDPGTEVDHFLRLAMASRSIVVLPITIDIAVRSAALELHGDPADRLIAATSVEHDAPLVTSDKSLRQSIEVDTLW